MQPVQGAVPFQIKIRKHFFWFVFAPPAHHSHQLRPLHASLMLLSSRPATSGSTRVCDLLWTGFHATRFLSPQATWTRTYQPRDTLPEQLVLTVVVVTSHTGNTGPSWGRIPHNLHDSLPSTGHGSALTKTSDDISWEMKRENNAACRVCVLALLI